MDISNINNSIEQLNNILFLSVEQSTDIAEKLIKVNVEQKIREGTAEQIGTVIDIYA